MKSNPSLVLPDARGDWLRLAFWALEALVVGMTLRDASVRLLSAHGEHLAHWFYVAYAVSALSLFSACFFYQRRHRGLAWAGWVTAVIAILWSGVDMPVY